MKIEQAEKNNFLSFRQILKVSDLLIALVSTMTKVNYSVK